MLSEMQKLMIHVICGPTTPGIKNIRQVASRNNNGCQMQILVQDSKINILLIFRLETSTLHNNVRIMFHPKKK